jgi:E3 ubiquitin-protein ligase BIG BROTHER-like protein
MQEQERAFYQASALRNRARNGGAQPSGEVAGSADGEESSDGDTEADGEDPEEGEDGEGASEEQLDDEELARRIFVEEQLEHQRHLMLMAGLDPDASSEDEDEGDDEEQYLTDDSLEPDDMTYEELRALGDAVGVVSRGAAPSLIQALPLARYVAPEAEVGGGAVGGEVAPAGHVTCRQEEQCVICRMEFEVGEDVKLMPCKHIFHPGCLDQWLVINKACPICAKELSSAEVEKQEKATEGTGVQTAQIDKCA